MRHLFMILLITLFNNCSSTKNIQNNDNNYLEGNYSIKALNENLITDKDLTISFDKNSELISGFSGCNTFSGNYKKIKSTLHFSKLASTKKYCPEKAETEDELLSNLNLVKKISLKNTTLIFLLSENDETLITLEKK